ncbi:MAG TPA: polyprenyl synthetase family protein [Sedimentisphaerales bacterium]|nr:polyprenyl synthetase family protein [Sedimentisphaerales bacterium]
MQTRSRLSYTMQTPASDISDAISRHEVPPFALISADLAKVESLVAEQLTDGADTAGVAQLLAAFGSGRGKMLRPGLVLLAGGVCGRITEKHVRVGAIAELIHSATLLHDDVIDEGEKRRGKPTVNSLWGNESAVLLGDLLLSKALRMCADIEPDVIRMLGATAVRVCQGELRQVFQRQNWQLSEFEYIETIREKSAALFSCCCRLGCLLAGGGEREGRRLADFGLNFGIAFQITDDLLDIMGDEEKMGKTLGRDAYMNKPTLAVIHLLREIGTQENTVTNGRSVSELTGRNELVEMLKASGSLEYAQSRASEFVAEAIAALAELRESDAKKALIETAGFVGRRGR